MVQQSEQRTAFRVYRGDTGQIDQDHFMPALYCSRRYRRIRRADPYWSMMNGANAAYVPSPCSSSSLLQRLIF